MNSIRTHKLIDPTLCGNPLELKTNYSRIELITSSKMAVDEKGLIHGGFIFGLADYAAMLAVNDPNVVLGSSESKFLKPVRVGDTVIAEAIISSTDKKKRFVDVGVTRDGVPVFKGSFTCFILDNHVLD
ncbi:PaaI family thioesterase [bacterium]|nr:PaaI family thioesterase [bacterium]